MSTEALVTSIREAAGARRKLRIGGAGKWMHAGRPTQTHETLSLAADKGVVDYVPDDLTITVRAGTTLDEIAAVTRASNQWLPLDPIGASSGTIGATIATSSSGPLAHSFGFARDFILGLEFVTGKSDVVRTGGRVVKNVAGFDLMRLMCGSWGTLGVIAQASLRLYALPKVDRTFALLVPPGGDALSSFLESLRAAPLVALSMEMVNGSLAALLGLTAKPAVLVRLGGNATLVEAQLKTLAEFGSPTEAGTEVWARLAEMETTPAHLSLRLSGLPTRVGQMWDVAEKIGAGGEDTYIHSTFSRGIVRVVARGWQTHWSLPKSDAAQRVVFELLPPELWQTISPSVTSDRLSKSVQRAYDPQGVLNPGILG